MHIVTIAKERNGRHQIADYEPTCRAIVVRWAKGIENRKGEVETGGTSTLPSKRTGERGGGCRRGTGRYCTTQQPSVQLLLIFHLESQTKTGRFAPYYDGDMRRNTNSKTNA